MTELEELKQKAGRYKRLIDNKDFTDTLDDMEGTYNLNESVISACNCPNASEYLFAKGGMRNIIYRMRNLADEFEQQVKNYKEDEDKGEQSYE